LSALAGLKVVELSRGVAAAYCGRQFAAWGADVVVLEPDGGSPLRRRSPWATGASGKPHSLLWANVAANKRTMRLSALADGGLAGLLASADIFVTDHTEAELAGLGVSLDGLRRDLPALCAVAISPFGRTGPYAGYASSQIVEEALSGYLSLNGLMGEPPLRAPGHLVSYAIGVSAFVGVLAAYVKRQRTGWGDLVEASGMESLATLVPFLRVQYLASEKLREGGTEAGVRILPCADGWISLLIVNPTHKDLWTEVLAIPQDAWPAEIYQGAYLEVVGRVEEFLSRYTRLRTADDLFMDLERRGVVCGKVMSPSDLLAEPQLEARGFFRDLQHPDLGPLRYAGPPARMGRSDLSALAAAPELDQAVGPQDLGWTAAATPVGAAAAAAETPLQGMRVLDLTQAWIGPFATLLFADLGADVIKIESHKRPDVWRQTSPNPVAITNVEAKKVNRSHYFNSVNRNKRDLTLDLRSVDGKALFLRLVKDADVVAENYTAHVMQRFGLDYAVLNQVNPALVMMSSSGFGKTGPWSGFRTNGSAIEALAGWDYLHAYPGGRPLLMGFYQADAICGLQMAALTLICLLKRARGDGTGDSIDGAMLEASTGYIGDLILQAQFEGEVKPRGNRDPDMAPNGVFPCAGEDRWIALSVPDDNAWQALLALGACPPELRDARYASLEGRQRHEDVLEAILTDWTRTQDADALMRLLQAAHVPAGVVRGLVEGLDDPHLTARDWFKTMSREDIGAYKYNGFPWRFSRCELLATLPPPRLGEHSEALLREVLSLRSKPSNPKT
jgi:crotonobetainyl-CoA:carnitine CoA-transferase CaiB-like acyl-CoA transferase